MRKEGAGGGLDQVVGTGHVAPDVVHCPRDFYSISSEFPACLRAGSSRSSNVVVIAPADAGSGRAPPVWAVWPVAVARGHSARGCRVKSGCAAIADSDRRGTGVCHHRSRSAVTTIPTRPATANARIKSARQSAAKWNQPAIAQSTAGLRAGCIANRRCPTRSQSGDSAGPIEHRHFGAVALACSAGSGSLRS